MGLIVLNSGHTLIYQIAPFLYMLYNAIEMTFP